MYRPPPNNRPRGGAGGGGGFLPTVPYQNQNHALPFLASQQYYQNLHNLASNPFLNPTFFQSPNPYLLNSLFPHAGDPSLNSHATLEALDPAVVEAQQDIAGGGGGGGGGENVPSWKISQAAPKPPKHFAPTSVSSHAGIPSLDSRSTLERVEATVVKAQQEIAAAGENVSAWKVSQAALVALKVDSWSSLGLQLQDVPSLRGLLILEGKVNAFIHCFVAARRITTLYDLEVALCKSEGIELFNELGLGPLCRHPLAEHYFSVPSNSLEVFEITTEEIIGFLKTYVNKSHKMITAEEFLDFIIEKKSVSAKEMLGVRLRSLGFYISCIRKAEKAERAVIKRFAKSSKLDAQAEREGQPPVSLLQEDLPDQRFNSICKRVASFASAWDFAGKHTRFEFSDDEDNSDVSEDSSYCQDDCGEKDVRNSCNQSSSYPSDNTKRVSSCPYPSTSEEMARLGLKLEKVEHSPSVGRIPKESRGHKSSGKKRKFGEKDDSSSTKLFKKRSAYLETLTVMVEKFITMWREACCEHSISEVLDMMVDYYAKTAKQKKNMKELFSSYPGVGLLNVAVTSIKIGMLADRNVTLQTPDGQKFSNKRSTKKMKIMSDGDTGEFQMKKFITTWKEACQKHSVTEVLNQMVDFYGTTTKQKNWMKKLHSSFPGVGIANVAVTSIKHGMLVDLYDMFRPSGERRYSSQSSTSTDILENEHVVKENACEDSRSRVTVNDIIKKVVDYVVSETLTPKESGSSLKIFQSFRKLHDCERWLINELSSKEFSSLGHGNFIEFLERHASILPQEFLNFLGGTSCDPSWIVVSMPQQQLGVFLSQAHYNWTSNGIIDNNEVSVLLKRQFPTITFHIAGDDPDKYFSSQAEKHRSTEILNSVLFSATLLGKQNSHISQEGNEKCLGQAVGSLKPHNSAETISSKNAVECLLEAPMLSDLCSWSHWDLVYAPSFGPLLEWLLFEVKVKNLLCVVTRDGKLIRVDPSATVDEFLEAFIRCSSSEIALKLLSLLALYRGTCNAPVSLLKSYTKQAIDVVIRNSMDQMEFKAADGNCTSPLQENLKLHEEFSGHPCLNDNKASFELVKEDIKLGNSLSKANKAFIALAKLVLESLSHLPSEFWCFAADILVFGFRSFTKEAPLIILHECSELDHRLMLHEIGLSLGVTEWIQDYHNLRTAITTSKSFQTSLYAFCSEDSMHWKNASDISANPSSNGASLHVDVDDGCLSDDYHESIDKTKEKNCDVLPFGCLTTSDDILKKGILTDVKSDNFGISEEMKAKDANLVIETIRKEEFGLDQMLNDTNSCLLKKQHARLGRALHCLSQELYSQDSHLLLELVQNADDNIYPECAEPTVVFILQENGIVVLNNEQGFSAENIRALCDIGNSTKKGCSAGYIGNKGIGFKSVFRVTDAPEIHSNGFHIKFDITDGQIGFVLPTLVPPCDINMFRQLLSGKDIQNDGNWNTCIILPFKSKFKEVTDMSSILSMFSDLHPSLLLFLHRLRCIKFKNMVNGTFLVMRKKIMDDGIVKVSHGKEAMSWLVIRKRLEATMVRPNVQTTEIALAFTLQETDKGEYEPYLNQQPAFAFLPLRNYGLKFILQGDFVLPSSREEVDGDSDWNQWLLSEFPALFISAEQSFCSLPCFQKNLGKAVTAYMSFVPLVGEVHGFFSHLPHMIISRLRTSNCLLLDGPSTEWILPCRALRGWNEQTRLLLSNSLLQKHLGLGYLSRDIFLSDSLAKALGVNDYGPKILIDMMSSLCCVKDGIKSLSLGWLSCWLFNLSSTLSAKTSVNFTTYAESESDLVNCLRKLPFIPLSDGSYSSISDGPIWIPCDTFNVGFDGRHSPKDFPNLYAKLRIVNPLLFSATTTTYSLEDTRVDDLKKMLYKIGVQRLSAHEVIKSHILVALSDSKQTNDNSSWRIEYLAFILVHFQSYCASCHCEKAEIISELRGKAIVLTNEGYKCATSEPIHFGKEYGNSMDIGKLIGSLDLKWLEVDVAYLKHPSIQSLSSGPAKWRDFFHELGVTDFMQVLHVNKHVSDALLSRSLPFSGDLTQGPFLISDYESPELVAMLSTLSSKKCRDQCIYFLELLDKMWDDHYSSKVTGSIISKTAEYNTPTESSFIKSIREIKWIASNMDEELHCSADLFYDCQEMRSVMGHMAPYAVPKVTSKSLLKDIGFKTQLSYNEALNILRDWSISEAPFLASAAQMSKFYTYISDGIHTLRVKLTEEFMSSSFIFVPFLNISKNDDVTHGAFYSPKDVYWRDPTGCVEKTKEMLMQCKSSKKLNRIQCQALSTTYPGLHDFFVHSCGVRDVPSFGSYIQILLQLSSVALPSQAAHSFYRVLLSWSDDLESKSAKPEEILNLKENLHKLENKILPTLQDKWVSLHPSFGLVCWADDEELKKQFKHSSGVDFLQLGEHSFKEKDKLFAKFAELMKNIGVPALSEVVSREAISYGIGENREKLCLIDWVLPYAQRYIFKFHQEIYFKLKQHGFQILHQLKVVIVDKLYYKHTLKGSDSTSKKHLECSCLLQGNVLYALPTTDCHSIFLELSRLFFDGPVELHLANFLHMITTMAESGSTNEQIEFFIVNSQKVPSLPDEEPIWSLTNLEELLEAKIYQPANAVSTSVEKKISMSQKKPGINPNWPPTDWKTAPGYSRKNHLGSRSGPTSYYGSRTELTKASEAVTKSEVQHVPLEVDEELIIEESLASRSTLMLQDYQSGLMGSCDALGRQSNSVSQANFEVSGAVTFPEPEIGLTNFSAWQDKDRLCVQTSDDQQLRDTGRLGEIIAYKYFKEQLGCRKVKWMNEENETGLPYDLIIGDDDSREYIEVKATKSASKDWFQISTREWQFASEMGESFSILRVVLLGKKKASISVLKNPLKLCQQNALGLAILMSKQARG